MTASLALPQFPELKASFGKIPLDLDEFGFDELPKCGQRLFIFLYHATNFATETVRVTDAQIAAMCHRSRSWVQKALAAICDRVVTTSDGEEYDAPIARRYRAYGSRDKAGRVIEIVAGWAKRLKPKPKPGGLAGSAASSTRSKPKPQTQAAAAIEPVPVPVPVPEPTDRAALDQLRDLIAKTKAGQAPSRGKLASSFDAARAEREATEKKRAGLIRRAAQARAILDREPSNPVAASELEIAEQALADLDRTHPARE